MMSSRVSDIIKISISLINYLLLKVFNVIKIFLTLSKIVKRVIVVKILLLRKFFAIFFIIISSLIKLMSLKFFTNRLIITIIFITFSIIFTSIFRRN